MSLSGNHDVPLPANYKNQINLPANYKNQIKHGSYIN